MPDRSEHMQRRGKTGIWYARLRIPADLAKAFGKAEFSKSLKTTDQRTARKLARQVIADWERQFDEARRKPDLSTADVETLARHYYLQREQEDLQARDRRPVASQQESLTDQAMTRMIAKSAQNPDILSDPLAMLNVALDEIANLDLSDMNFEHRQIRLRDLREHQRTRNFALITHEAIALIDTMSLPIAVGSEEFNLLCDRLIRAEIELLQRQNERDVGNFAGEARDPVLRRGSTKLDLTSLGSIIDEQEKRSQRGIGGTKSASTFRKYRSIIKEFCEWRKSPRAASVTTEEVERWRDELIDQEFSPKTVRDKISCIKSVLTWGQKHSNGSLFAGSSPLDLLELPALDEQDSSQRTYTVLQAETVLLASRERSLSYQRWVPWMLAYSGARVTEILQLTKEDFFRMGEHWFYHIRHGGERTTKTKKSRKVPVHAALIEEGLIKFVENAPAGKLFTDKRMDGNLRDWIRAEVLPDLPDPKPGPNHGFRHLFEDMRYGAIDADASDYITGRANKGSAAGYGKSNAMLPALARQMEKFPRFLGAARNEGLNHLAEPWKAPQDTPPQ